MAGVPAHSLYVRPSLLDRLAPPERVDSTTSDTGGETESSGMRDQVYKDTVERDLHWLFNAVSPLGMAQSDLRRKYPHTAASILGCGLRGILGRAVHDRDAIRQQVEGALAVFEPRLVVEKMSLKLTQEGRLIEIELSGLLLTQQTQRRVWIRTDLETLDSKLKTEANG